jgi:hypothetical protein
MGQVLNQMAGSCRELFTSKRCESDDMEAKARKREKEEYVP